MSSESRWCWQKFRDSVFVRQLDRDSHKRFITASDEMQNRGSKSTFTSSTCFFPLLLLVFFG